VTDAQHAQSVIRTTLVVGPILTCVGIAWTAVAPSTFSNAAILIGFATCIYGTHRFGRLGKEDPVEFEVEKKSDDDEDEADAK